MYEIAKLLASQSGFRSNKPSTAQLEQCFSKAIPLLAKMERCGQAHLSKANQKLVKLRTRLNCEAETTLGQPSDCPLNHPAFNADVMFGAKKDPQ